jgi:Flp pilus assembly protein TadG
VVELALVLPILVTLALGIFDLSCAIRANNILINVSREGASLALRTSRSAISAEDLMNSLAATAQPLVLSLIHI